MSIYTKRGDKGITDMARTRNISKSDDRIRHTGTLEVASIATTSDILNVFFAMPFFVFLIFVMIIVPLWVVDRLILEKISYEELISDLWNIRIL